MPAIVYPLFRQDHWAGVAGRALAGATVRSLLVDVAAGGGTPYTLDSVNDQYLADIPAGARISTSPNGLANQTFVNGLWDADDQTGADAHSAVSTAWDAVVTYIDSGSAATSPLVTFDDTLTAPAANGSDVGLQFPSGLVQF